MVCGAWDTPRSLHGLGCTIACCTQNMGLGFLGSHTYWLGFLGFVDYSSSTSVLWILWEMRYEVIDDFLSDVFLKLIQE